MMRRQRVAAVMLLSFLLSHETARGEGLVETTSKALEAGLLAVGDLVEFGYRLHPGARLARKTGILPPGKLGILPSHPVRPSDSRGVRTAYPGRRVAAPGRRRGIRLDSPAYSRYRAYRRRAALNALQRQQALARQRWLNAR